MKLQKLYLVRHAQTTLHGKYCGSIDAPLSATGMLQAKRLKRFFKKIPLEVCFASDLKRAQQTFKALSKGKLVPCLNSSSLREISFGDWEGKDYKTVSVLYPKAYRLWMENPFQIKFPNGESFKEFYARVDKFSKFLRQVRSSRVLIVAHGGTLAALKMILLKKTKSQFWKLLPELASVSILKRELNKNKFVWES